MYKQPKLYSCTRRIHIRFSVSRVVRSSNGITVTQTLLQTSLSPEPAYHSSPPQPSSKPTSFHLTQDDLSWSHQTIQPSSNHQQSNVGVPEQSQVSLSYALLSKVASSSSQLPSCPPPSSIDELSQLTMACG